MFKLILFINILSTTPVQDIMHDPTFVKLAPCKQTHGALTNISIAQRKKRLAARLRVTTRINKAVSKFKILGTVEQIHKFVSLSLLTNPLMCQSFVKSSYKMQHFCREFFFSLRLLHLIEAFY